VSGWPSGSVEPALENVTLSGAGPLVGVPLNTAVGARLLLRYRIRRILLMPNVPLVSE
jgi:hypothetical protein